jgi:hypothetical protein
VYKFDHFDGVVDPDRLPSVSFPVELVVGFGAEVSGAIVEAIELAGVVGRSVVFEFNGRRVFVNAGDDSDVVFKRWFDAVSAMCRSMCRS